MIDIIYLIFLFGVLIFGYKLYILFTFCWNFIKSKILEDFYLDNLSNESKISIFLRNIYDLVLGLPSKLNESVVGFVYGLMALFIIILPVFWVFNFYDINISLFGVYLNSTYFIYLLRRILKLRMLISKSIKGSVLMILIMGVFSLPMINVFCLFLYHIYHYFQDKGSN